MAMKILIFAIIAHISREIFPLNKKVGQNRLDQFIVPPRRRTASPFKEAQDWSAFELPASYRAVALSCLK
jgi:hypothetical protein